MKFIRDSIYSAWLIRQGIFPTRLLPGFRLAARTGRSANCRLLSGQWFSAPCCTRYLTRFQSPSLVCLLFSSPRSTSTPIAHSSSSTFEWGAAACAFYQSFVFGREEKLCIARMYNHWLSRGNMKCPLPRQLRVTVSNFNFIAKQGSTRGWRAWRLISSSVFWCYWIWLFKILYMIRFNLGIPFTREYFVWMSELPFNFSFDRKAYESRDLFCAMSNLR